MNKKFLCILLATFFVLFSIPALVSAVSIDTPLVEQMIDYYEYPITTDSPDWFEYSVLEKARMLEIPKDTLLQMTDEALLQAIAEYPYLCDIYLYGNGINDGITVASSYFSALEELRSRDTESEALLNYGITLANEYTAKAQSASDAENRNSSFVARALVDILNALNDEYIVTYNSTNSTWYLEDVTFDYEIRTETHTTAEHDGIDAQLLTTYNVTRITRGSCKYNCHSYAWYSRLSTNTFWIYDPSPFMESSDYVCVSTPSLGTPANSTSIKYGDIIFYGNLNGNPNTWHSAVYHSNSTTGEPIAHQTCWSKWGLSGVFEHELAEVPASYDVSNLSAWRPA